MKLSSETHRHVVINEQLHQGPNTLCCNDGVDECSLANRLLICHVWVLHRCRASLGVRECLTGGENISPFIYQYAFHRLVTTTYDDWETAEKPCNRLLVNMTDFTDLYRLLLCFRAALVLSRLIPKCFN